MYNKKIILLFSIVLVTLFILPIQSHAGIFNSSPEEEAAKIHAESQERIAKSQAEATKTAALIIAGTIVFTGLIALIISENKKNINVLSPTDINENSRQEPETDPIKHTLFCSQCGKKINPGDLFCSGCGRKLEN